MLRSHLRHHCHVHYPTLLPIHRVGRVAQIRSPASPLRLPARVQLRLRGFPYLANWILHCFLHRRGSACSNWLSVDVYRQHADHHRRNLRVQRTDRFGFGNVPATRPFRRAGQSAAESSACRCGFYHNRPAKRNDGRVGACAMCFR